MVDQMGDHRVGSSTVLARSMAGQMGSRRVSYNEVRILWQAKWAAVG